MEQFLDFMSEIGGPVFLIILTLFTVVLVPLGLLGYYSSCREAAIFNSQNGTMYTCGDFFWAADQINSQTATLRIKQ